ncbi:MAG: hypothetical protein MJ188_02135 [Treponema sp.]|nr:hypothetical protein [Treponema sp.]
MKLVKKILTLILFSVAFLSCTQVVPEVKSATATIIFEYKSLDSLPTARFSVFVESNSDAHRYETMKVTSNSTNYVWELNEVIKIQNSNRMFAGNTNMIVPEGEKIPFGEYHFVYTNADGEKVETNLNFNYDSAFYTTKASEIPAFMKTKFGKKYIAIYDNENKLLFYGERTDNLSDTRKIWNKYKTAHHFNEVWTLQNSSVMCILPTEDVVPSQK